MQSRERAFQRHELVVLQAIIIQLQTSLHLESSVVQLYTIHRLYIHTTIRFDSIQGSYIAHEVIQPLVPSNPGSDAFAVNPERNGEQTDAEEA
jgi:hypothetical protein